VRKLELMPEVLPEPKRVTTGAGDARARTMAHLQRLLATAAAGGTLLGCTREGTLGPDTRRESGAGIPTAATSAKLDLPEAGAPPTATTTTPPPTGYAVVDPVPMPAACPGLASEVRAAAVWVSAPAGAVAVSLGLVPGSADAVIFEAGGVASIVNATLYSRAGTGKTRTLVVQPSAGASAVLINVPSHCNGRPVNVSLALDVVSPGSPGSPVPMSVSSY
jgi:hypothetical protein